MAVFKNSDALEIRRKCLRGTCARPQNFAYSSCLHWSFASFTEKTFHVVNNVSQIYFSNEKINSLLPKEMEINLNSAAKTEVDYILKEKFNQKAAALL